MMSLSAMICSCLCAAGRRRGEESPRVRLDPRQHAAFLAACQDDSLIRLNLTLGSMSVNGN